MNNKKYIVYQITNKVNEMIYVGVHGTYNINDKYMGSGHNLVKAFIEQGKENFIKEILFVYDNEQEALSKEAEIVNKEFIARTDTYNVILGGGKLTTKGCVCVRDKDNNIFMVYKTDPRYISKELVSIHKGKIVVKDKEGNRFQVSVNDPRYLSGELIGHTKNKVTVKDKNGKNFMVNINDPRYLSGELIHNCKGLKNYVSNDTRKKMSNAKLGSKNNFYGKHHTEESKDKYRKTMKKLDLFTKEFYVYSIDGIFISKEKGIGQYAKLNNMSRGYIIDVLKGRKKSYKNHIFFNEYQGERCNID